MMTDLTERRCGGPGCDMTCCQPVEEPQGCAHCNHPLYAATKCRVCGRVTEPVQEDMVKCRQIAREYAWPNSNIDSGNLYWALHVALRRIDAAQPQRKPLTEEEIFKIENDIPDDVIGDRAWTICFARAIERAHKIGGEE